MDTSAKKILENVAIKALHAQGFSRTSAHTNAVLTDVLSRYLAQVAATVAKYAEHAGRRRLMARDAVEAFDELGTSVDELKDYCTTECRDMARYSTQSTKRVEELNEFKAQLAFGLVHDDDDLIPLEWGPVPDSLPSEEEDESEYEEVKTPADEHAKGDILMVEPEDPDAEGEDDIPIDDTDVPPKDPLARRHPTPPLPLSPISNSSPPPRKRQRTETWQPPEHVPDWLPPFPSGEQPRAGSPQTLGIAPAPSDPAAIANNAVKVERPATPPLQAQVSTVSSSADYLTVVPYEQSSLGSLPSWHLPAAPSSNGYGLPKSSLPLPPTQQVLLEAYHHILTHPPPARPSAVNPGRYRVALALVQQFEKYNRWDAPTTLYGSTSPAPPRIAVMPPSYAVPIAKGPGTNSGAGTPDGSGKEKGEKEEEKRPLPGAYPRTIAAAERITPLLSRPGLRIPKLAKDVLSGPVYARTVRIAHPPVLQRGTQKLTYGPGVNAPWNSSFSPIPASTPAPGKGKEAVVNGMPNGKEKEKEKEGPRPLPDARMYATWNYEQKRFDEPLVVRRRVGSVTMQAGAVPMGRARSESTNA